MLAADGLGVQLEQPGVLLLRRLGPADRGEWGRHVRALTGLGMLICRIEYVAQDAHFGASTG
jgi:hypothetical protein